MNIKLASLAITFCVVLTSCTKERSPNELAEIWMKDYLKSHSDFQPRSIIPRSDSTLSGNETGMFITVVHKQDKTQKRTFQLLFTEESNRWKLSQATETKEGE